MTKSQRAEDIVTCKEWEELMGQFCTFTQKVHDLAKLFAKHESALLSLLNLFANTSSDGKPLVLDLRQRYKPSKKQSQSRKTVGDNATQGVQKKQPRKQQEIDKQEIDKLSSKLPELNTLSNHITHLNKLLENYCEWREKDQEDEKDKRYIHLQCVSEKLSDSVRKAFENSSELSINDLNNDYSQDKHIPIWLPLWTPAKERTCANLARKIHSNFTSHPRLSTFQDDLLRQLLTDTQEKVKGILDHDYKRTLGRQYQYLQDTKALFAHADSVWAVSIDRISTFWLPKNGDESHKNLVRDYVGSQPPNTVRLFVFQDPEMVIAYQECLLQHYNRYGHKNSNKTNGGVLVCSIEEYNQFRDALFHEPPHLHDSEKEDFANAIALSCFGLFFQGFSQFLAWLDHLAVRVL